MAQRGRQPNTKGTGASKKNKSVQKQSQNRRNNSSKNKVSGNQDQPKQRNSKNQGKSVEKNSDTWPNNENKMPLALQTKSNRRLPKSIGKKNHHGVSQEKTNTPIWIRCRPITFNPHNASNALADTPTWYYFSCPSHLAFHDFTKNTNHKKTYTHC